MNRRQRPAGAAGVGRRPAPLAAAGLLAFWVAAGAQAQGANASRETAGAETAHAPEAATPLFQPGAWPTGAWLWTPQVDLATGDNDNLRLQSSQPIRSPFVVVVPSLSVQRTRGDDTWQFAWRSEWTRFTRSAADDTLDSELSAESLQVLAPRTAMTWNLGWQDGHDALGLALPDQSAQTPDHFHAAAFGAIVRHDAGAADEHRFELEPTVSSRRYLNHRDFTFEADAATASLAARYLHLLAPGHRTGLELRAIRTRYPNGDLALSDVDRAVVATCVWDAGDGPSGHASLGGQWRAFDAYRPAWRGVTWDVDWQWPLDVRDSVTLTTRRAADEAPGEGVDEVVSRRAALEVSRQAAARWRGSIAVSDAVEHYVGAALARDDEVQAASVAAQYDLSRRFRLAVNLGWVHRHSQVAAFDFTRRLYSITLSVGM